jgi:hypothetical protein
MVKKRDPFFVRVCGSANNKTQTEKKTQRHRKKKTDTERKAEREIDLMRTHLSESISGMFLCAPVMIPPSDCRPRLYWVQGFTFFFVGSL